MKYLILDYESRSEVNLRKTGAFFYANHPSTRILSVAWREINQFGNHKNGAHDIGPIEVWSPAFPASNIEKLVQAFHDPDFFIVAHNAMFEQLMTQFVFSKIAAIPFTPPERWICTAALGAALGLPRKLEDMTKAMGLPLAKDMEGHKLMLKLSKPRKATKHNKAKWHTKAKDLRRVMEYNKTDVEVDTHLLLAVPALSQYERSLWCLNQQMNHRGFCVDRPLIKQILEMVALETERLDAECSQITGGQLRSARQRDALLAWNKENSAWHNRLHDLKAKTITDFLREKGKECPPILKRLLEIRQAVSKSSTAKFKAANLRSGVDGRIHDFLLFYAGHTGRSGGQGFQPQNLTRPTLSDWEIEMALDILK